VKRSEVKKDEFMLKNEHDLEDLWSRSMNAIDEQVEKILEDRYLLDLSMSVGMSMAMPTKKPVAPTRTPAPISQSAAPILSPTSSPISSPPIGTLSPTSGDCLFGTTREAYILASLSQVADPALLVDPSTPQGMAIDWITLDDPLKIDPCVYPTLEQRYGLATIYFATGGANWINNNEWLSAMPECQWFGITCDAKNVTVDKINLNKNNLIGTIPNEISTLYDATCIEFYMNKLASNIPTGIRNLTALQLLDLENNSLSGSPFTSEILSLTSLIALRGSSNNFEGIIPSDIGRLTGLEQLWLSVNTLTGSLPSELGLLTSMQTVFLYNNMLTRAIPSEIGLMSNLMEISLSYNILTGTIPSEFFNLTSLLSLRLDVNDLTGSIPTSIGKLIYLSDLRLGDNPISGTIPSELGTLYQLENLILNKMYIENQIPNDLKNLFSLQFLDMSSNSAINGTFPQDFFSFMEDLRLVYFSNCSLTGPFPASFANVPGLRDFFLDGNSLTGTVPTIPDGKLLKLNELLIQNNQFTGSVPESICKLRNNATGAILEDLWADCGGAVPQLQCTFPTCCNRCF